MRKAASSSWSGQQWRTQWESSGLNLNAAFLPRVTYRQASLTSIIERGRRNEHRRRGFGEEKSGRETFVKDVRKSGDRVERSRRDFERPGDRSERPGQDFDRSSDRSERPRRDFDRSSDRSERPRRDFDRSSDRSERPRRDFDRSSDRSERPRRDFDSPNNSFEKPRRDFDRSGDRPDRPRRDFDRPDRKEWKDSDSTFADSPNRRQYSRNAERGFDQRRARGKPTEYQDGFKAERPSYERSDRPRSDDRRSRRDSASSSYRNDDFDRGDNEASSSRGGSSSSRPDRSSVYERQSAKLNVVVPTSIPYTTPASEFLYGHSTILSAIRSNRRKFYKLYLYASPDRTTETEARMEQVRKHALLRGIDVRIVSAQWSSIMDKMSGGRPHNGVLLEASPLPKMPVTALDMVESAREPHITVSLAHQNAEDAAINGTTGEIRLAPPAPLWARNPRYPLVLLLTSIQDPGNLGSILRTAHYLGVAAIVLATHSTSPITPVVLKASSGAAEAIPLCTAKNIVEFIDSSKRNGWKFYAAAAPHSASAVAKTAPKKAQQPTNTVVQETQNKPLPFIAPHELPTLLRNGPAVLMLGGEGSGLDPRAQKRADALVGINSAWGRDDIAKVDSLNVGVAAGMLAYAFMRGGAGAAANAASEGLAEEGEDGEDASEGKVVDEDRLFQL